MQDSFVVKFGCRRRRTPPRVWLLASCCGCINQIGVATGWRMKGINVVQ